MLTSYSAAVISNCSSFVFSFIPVIIYSFALPVTSAPVACCPVIAYITSLLGAELNALDTVTFDELYDEIGFVSILWSSDHITCTWPPESSFNCDAEA